MSTTSRGSYSNTYSYDNPKWLNLLTAFNDEPIAYEGQTYNAETNKVSGDPTSGNPISYFNGTRWSFDWENGRQLASASTTDGDTIIDINYTYDINGLRTSKTITRTTGSGTAHTHEYTSTVTAPTCTTAGYTTYTCDCGESYVDNLVDALGHNYVQSGNVYTCSRCGDSYTGHEHSYTESTTEPTCTQAGYTTYTCSCGDSYTVDLPALGHDYVLVSQNGNVATYQCSRCGYRYSVVVPVVPQPPVEYGLRNGNVVVTTEHHEYIYASGKLLREVITTTDAEGNTTAQTLDFTYDASGSPYTLTRTVGTTSSTYYYVVNLQGDVMRLVSANGATVVEYWYDPWGRVLSASGAMAETNPLRYRGYYYDAETEFYYLQSRYYDPAICRFVNADGYASTGQDFLGCNMFAYCGSNPILCSDPTGELCFLAATIFIGAAVLVGGIFGAASAASTEGDLVEGAIEGAITGGIAASCAVFVPVAVTALAPATVAVSTIEVISTIATPVVAGTLGVGVDVAVQTVAHASDNGSLDDFEVDWARAAKTGATTAISSAAPTVVDPASGIENAVCATIVNFDVSALIVVADIIFTRFVLMPQ